MGSTLRDDDVSPGLIHRHTSSDLIEHDFHLSCAHVTEGAVEPTSGWLFFSCHFLHGYCLLISCTYQRVSAEIHDSGRVVMLEKTQAGGWRSA